MIKAVVRWQRRTVRAMALHFPLYRGCDLSSHWWCRSLNKRITCQLLLGYMGTVQTSMVTISNLKHESSNLTHSGTDGEGSKKSKTQKKHSQDSRGRILRMLVAQREHHRQESVPVRYIRMPMSLRLGFLTSYDMLTNVKRVVSQ